MQHFRNDPVCNDGNAARQSELHKIPSSSTNDIKIEIKQEATEIVMQTTGTIFVSLSALVLLLNNVSAQDRPQRHHTFPPSDLQGNDLREWFRKHVATAPLRDPDPTWNMREKELSRMSVIDFIKARKTGSVNCTEYVQVLLKRAEHYADMNALMYDFDQNKAEILKQANGLDEKAHIEGIEAIAPFYCLPITVKGTMATVDFPSSAGIGILHDTFGIKDAEAVSLLKTQHGLAFGKSNVPDFAASGITCNYATGCALNPYSKNITTGGSSGGAASLVASYIAPVAFSEDTAGSTRQPASQNHLFGYDPSRNRYPNAGNQGITFLNDQIGILARSMDDILTFDAAFLDLEECHKKAKAISPSLRDIRVGLPQYPFVEYWVPLNGTAAFTGPKWPTTKKVSTSIYGKYEQAVSALRDGGIQLVEEEWPTSTTNPSMNVLEEQWHNGLPPGFDPILDGLQTFAGQATTWTHSYLNASVSMNDLVEDMRSIGDFHTPGVYFDPRSSHNQRKESNFRYAMGAFQQKTVRAWNSYFDKYDIDLIMVPVHFCDAITYESVADASLTLQIGFEGSNYKPSKGSFMDCTSLFFGWKNIPIPKVVVPVGLDNEGNPVSMIFWGRSGPKDPAEGSNGNGLDWLYDDGDAKERDIDFLYKVNSVVSVLHKEPSLQRSLPPLVTKGESNIFGKGNAMNTGKDL